MEGWREGGNRKGGDIGDKERWRRRRRRKRRKRQEKTKQDKRVGQVVVINPKQRFYRERLNRQDNIVLSR